jgi:hypothetical protein
MGLCSQTEKQIEIINLPADWFAYSVLTIPDRSTYFKDFPIHGPALH